MANKDLDELEHQKGEVTLTLSLKLNNSIETYGAKGKQHYQLLFDTYIKTLRMGSHGFLLKINIKNN